MRRDVRRTSSSNAARSPSRARSTRAVSVSLMRPPPVKTITAAMARAEKENLLLERDVEDARRGLHFGRQSGGGGELKLLRHVLAGHDDDVLAGRNGFQRRVLAIPLDR